MNTLALIAITWIGKEYRFLGLDWSYLVILGLIGNATFSMRFLVQWIASERQGESVIPVSFWYWSIAGSVIMCLYFIFKRDPVGILAYLPNSLIYIRNLMLIRKGSLLPLLPRLRSIPARWVDGIIPRFVSDFEIRISDFPPQIDLLLSNPSPCESVRGRWDDRKR